MPSVSSEYEYIVNAAGCAGEPESQASIFLVVIEVISYLPGLIMEQLSISILAIPWITTTSLFNCSGQWTSGSGQGIESSTTTVCLTR